MKARAFRMVRTALMLAVCSTSLGAQTRPLSEGARETVAWVQSQRALAGKPFIVLDKRQAHAWVFDA